MLQLPDGTRFQVLAPVVHGRKGETVTCSSTLLGAGPSARRVDGEVVDLPAKLKLERYEQHKIEVVVDRLVRRAGIERRLTDSLETALKLAEGVAEVEIVEKVTRQTRVLHVQPTPCLPNVHTWFDGSRLTISRSTSLIGASDIRRAWARRTRSSPLVVG